jgi:hypothetical protein
VIAHKSRVSGCSVEGLDSAQLAINVVACGAVRDACVSPPQAGTDGIQATSGAMVVIEPSGGAWQNCPAG